jgi:hypothetical protein
MNKSKLVALGAGALACALVASSALAGLNAKQAAKCTGFQKNLGYLDSCKTQYSYSKYSSCSAWVAAVTKCQKPVKNPITIVPRPGPCGDSPENQC